MQEKVWREQLVSENWREVFHLEAWISFPPLISSRLFFDLINGYPGGKSSVLRRSRLRTISWRRALREYGRVGEESGILFRHCGLVVSLVSCD